jgi:hypothetical protein
VQAIEGHRRLTTQPDFTDDEWQTLLDLPRLAAFGAMAAEASGPIASTRELWAAMRELAAAARGDDPDTTLMQRIVAEIAQGGDDALEADVAWKPGTDNLGAAMIEQAIAAARRARVILAERASAEEAAQYAAWIVAIAHAGCAAVGGGWFGRRGDAVTPAEARFVRDLTAALAAP